MDVKTQIDVFRRLCENQVRAVEALRTEASAIVDMAKSVEQLCGFVEAHGGSECSNVCNKLTNNNTQRLYNAVKNRVHGEMEQFTPELEESARLVAQSLEEKCKFTSCFGAGEAKQFEGSTFSTVASSTHQADFDTVLNRLNSASMGKKDANQAISAMSRSTQMYKCKEGQTIKRLSCSKIAAAYVSTYNQEFIRIFIFFEFWKELRNCQALKTRGSYSKAVLKPIGDALFCVNDHVKTLGCHKIGSLVESWMRDFGGANPKDAALSCDQEFLWLVRLLNYDLKSTKDVNALYRRSRSGVDCVFIKTSEKTFT